MCNKRAVILVNIISISPSFSSSFFFTKNLKQLTKKGKSYWELYAEFSSLERNDPRKDETLVGEETRRNTELGRLHHREWFRYLYSPSRRTNLFVINNSRGYVYICTIKHEEQVYTGKRGHEWINERPLLCLRRAARHTAPGWPS